VFVEDVIVPWAVLVKDSNNVAGCACPIPNASMHIIDQTSQVREWK
jgi:hypothetical protein